MLACGPYFETGGIVLSLAIFLLLKPLAYFAFIQAFRFRVAREVPMTMKQAAGLAALRSLVGLVFVGMVWALLALTGNGSLMASWILLYLERIAAWWLIGRYAARLFGKRLAAWVIFGMIINVAFDMAVVIGLFVNAFVPVVFLGLILLIIYLMHVTGRRAELQSRFSTYPVCRVCQYNLTGNLSGICPECGTAILKPTDRPALAPGGAVV